MPRHTVYADFHNADPQGRVRLNCVGTSRDLAANRLTLAEGLRLNLSDDELETEGEAHYSDDEQLWVAVIDRDALRPKDRAPAVVGLGADTTCRLDERP